ncbi:hypothetical protein JCM21900_002980 [Sporobolomyces salmonicolor]
MSLSPDASDPAVTDPSNRIGPVLDSDEKDTIRQGTHVSWSFASAAWLATIATPLVFFPRVLSLIFGTLLVEMEAPENADKPGADVLRTLNILERSLAALAGIACYALAVLIVVQTGALPLTSSLSASRSVAASSAAAPFRAPTILIATSFFGVLAWNTYDLDMWVATAPSAALSVWGLWALLFAHQGRVNQASAKASSFPFKNKAAEEKKAEKKAE